MRSHEIRLNADDGETFRATLRLPDGPGPFPVVVGLHGFKGFKDWGFWPSMGEYFAARGIAHLAVNYAHNGVGAGEDFDRLDLFQSLTWTSMSADLHVALDAVADGTLPGGEALDPARVGLLGHSMGGGLAVVLAAERPEVRALVTWAAIAGHLGWVTPAIETAWRAAGVWQIPNARTGQHMPLGWGFAADLYEHAARFDIAARGATLRIPALVVHGRPDETVPFAQADALVRAIPRAELLARDGADHVFGAVHPFAGVTPDLAQVFEASHAFFRRHL